MLAINKECRECGPSGGYTVILRDYSRIWLAEPFDSFVWRCRVRI